MADNVGDISVGVTPDARGFVDKLRAQLLPGSEKLGNDVGDALSNKIAAKLKKAIEEGLGGASAPAKKKGTETAEDFGGAFARTAKARIEAAFKSLPKAELDINAAPAEAKLAEVRAELAALTKGGKITLDDKTLGTVARLQGELDALSKDRTANIRVRVDAKAAMTELAAIEAEVRAVDASSVKAAKSVGSKGGGLLGTFLALTPALIPIGAAASAAIGAFTLLGIAGVAAYKGIKDEVAAGTETGKAYKQQLDLLNDDWTRLKVTAAANVLGPFQASVAQIQTQMPAFNDNIGTFSGLLGRIGGSLTVGLIAGFNTLSPLLTEIGTGFANMADRFAKFASGTGLQAFGAYVESTLPRVEAFLSSTGTAVGHLIQAFAPFGSTVLVVLKAFADVVDALPIGLIAGLATAFSTLYLSIKLFNGISSIGSKIGSFGTKLGQLGAGASTASLAFTGIGAAASVATIGFALIDNKVQENHARMLAAAQAGQQLAESYREGGAAAVNAAGQIAGLQSNIAKIQANGLNSFGDVKSLIDSNIQIQSFNKNLKDYAANASVSTKQQDQLTSATNDYLLAVQKYGKDTPQASAAATKLYQAQTDLSQSQQDVADITDKATEAAGKNADAMGTEKDAAQAAKQKIDDLKQAIFGMTDVNLSAWQAQTDLATAQAEANKVAEDGTATDLDQQSALQGLVSSSESLIKAMIDQGDSSDVVTAKMTDLRAGFISTAEKMGYTKQEANDLADQMGLIPSDIVTTTEIPTYGSTIAELIDVRDKVEAVPAGKTVNVGALTKPAIDKLIALGYKVNTLPDGTVTVSAPTDAANGQLDSFITNANKQKITIPIVTVPGGGYRPTAAYAGANAAGGEIHGPGSGTSDSIVSRVSDGEFIVNEKDSQANLAALNALNNGARAYVMPGGNVAIPAATGPAQSRAYGDVTIVAQPWMDPAQILTEVDRRFAFAGAV